MYRCRKSKEKKHYSLNPREATLYEKVGQSLLHVEEQDLDESKVNAPVANQITEPDHGQITRHLNPR